MVEKIKVSLSNFRVEELPHSLGKGIVVDVEARGKKGKVEISQPKLAATCLLYRDRTVDSVVRAILEEKVEQWAREKGLVKVAGTTEKLLEELIERSLKGIRAVEV